MLKQLFQPLLTWYLAALKTAGYPAIVLLMTTAQHRSPITRPTCTRPPPWHTVNLTTLAPPLGVGRTASMLVAVFLHSIRSAVASGGTKSSKHRANTCSSGNSATPGSRCLEAERRGKVPARTATLGAVFQSGRQRVAVFVEHWWATRVGHRASTCARGRLILDHDVLPFFGKIAISEGDAADVQALVNALGSRLSPSSVRNVHDFRPASGRGPGRQPDRRPFGGGSALASDQSSRDALPYLRRAGSARRHDRRTLRGDDAHDGMGDAAHRGGGRAPPLRHRHRGENAPGRERHRRGREQVARGSAEDSWWPSEL